MTKMSELPHYASYSLHSARDNAAAAMNLLTEVERVSGYVKSMPLNPTAKTAMLEYQLYLTSMIKTHIARIVTQSENAIQQSGEKELEDLPF